MLLTTHLYNNKFVQKFPIGTLSEILFLKKSESRSTRTQNTRGAIQKSSEIKAK